MIIKKETKKKKFFNIINKLLLAYFFLSIVIISIPTAMFLKSSGFKQAQVNFLDKFSRSGRINYIYLPEILYGAVKSNFSNFEKINLEIGFEDILIIENLRSESLAKGELPPRHLLPRINIAIKYNDKTYNGDARLKGDRIIHFEKKNTTSYKIELDKENYIFGLKKFSIQKPSIRNYVHEWIFHELANEFGIIKLTYKFVQLYVNGEKHGLFVVEEGFGKELIERNERRNGPIFGLNEDLNYSNINPVFEIYNKKFWNRPENEPTALIASQKLRDFFDKKIKLDEVFDLDKWASYFAIIDLTGTWHGALLKSVKFYYNPINGLFEPIPFDGHRFKPNYKKFNLKYDNRLVIDFLNNPTEEDEKIGLGWLKGFFFNNDELNQEFYDLYVKKLTKISSEEFVRNFLDKNFKTIKKINSHIYRDSFWFHDRGSEMGLYYFSLDDFYYQAKNITNKLNREGGLQILKNPKKAELIIEDYFKNYSTSIVEKLICLDGNEKVEIKIDKKLKNFSKTSILLTDFKNADLSCKFASIYNKYSQKKILQKIDYINSGYTFKAFKDNNSSNYKKFFNEKNNELFLIEENTTIDQNLFIPEGYRVIIKENQKINLINKAFIISKSPWKIGGLGQKTFIGGLKNNLGGGLLIKDTENLSLIQNTNFSNLEGFNLTLFKEFNILGSINFYEADVKVYNTNFENIYSEDAINIFRSNFEIYKNIYKNIESDAIDIDFSKGEIKSSKFENIKNDAIDFSGSEAIVENSDFKNINDKVISVGEKSLIDISDISAIDSHAGIVSKDGSFVTSNNIRFDGVLVPFSAYQKKKEYSYGSLVVKNYDLKKFHTKWLKDKGSKITTDNEILKKSTSDIFNIINNKQFHLINLQND